MGLAGVAAFLVILGPRLPMLWHALHTPACPHRWGLWLVGHLVALGAFTYMTAAILDVAPAAVRPAILWPVTWVLSGATVVLLWLGALAPLRGWWHLLHQEYTAVLGASLVGIGAWGSGQLGQGLWSPLAAMTLGVVRFLLGLVYPEVDADLPARVVGTPTFQVLIAPECSGYEGVGCVTLLLTLYL
jgi:hypothetical protein